MHRAAGISNGSCGTPAVEGPLADDAYQEHILIMHAHHASARTPYHTHPMYELYRLGAARTAVPDIPGPQHVERTRKDMR